MGIANSTFVPDPFPGIHAPTTTGASGAAADRPPAGTVPLKGGGGLPGVGVVMGVADMARSGSDSTEQPGQMADGFCGVPESFTADSGAGQGTAGHHFPRRPWQQQDGAA